MQFRPQISFDQYRVACEALAAAKNQQTTKRTWKSYLWIVVLCLVIGLSFQVPVFRGPAAVWFGFAILILVSKPLAKRSQIKCYKRAYAEEQTVLNSQLLTITESGITCDQGSGKVVSHYIWQAFVKRIDTPEMFLFLPSPNSFVRVSKETFTPTELEQIGAWSSSIPTT